ncbi:MAG: RNA polymerase sigma factor region1.1 domain-containing protein, partial [Desulfobacula sp.]|nr:RNA polymerase sigma factor region1.1 domain-containing protein [Desulfobacula sp.]
MAGKTNKSGENVMISKKELQKLVKKGEKNGSLSFAEINDAMSDDLKSLDQIEDVVVQFKELGIKLVDKEKEKIKKAT